MKFKYIAALVLAVSFTAPVSMSAIELRQATLSVNRPLSPGKIVPSIDGTSYYKMESSSKILKIDYKTGKVLSTVFDASTARECTEKTFEGFEMSEDETKILLYTNSEPIYRYSFKADYYVFEIKRNKVEPLTEKGAVEIAKFSPDARMVAFVHENNIYLKKLDYKTEVAVTTDGKYGETINGVPDWVYQEEFGMLSSLTFSSDNMMLSYIKWNEKNVGMYSFPLYEGACNANSEYAQYPGSFTYKYPMAGTENSTVNVYSYDIETRKTKEMELPADTYYVADIRYAPAPDRLMVMTLNRNQNELRFYAVNPRSTIAKLVYTDNSESWIDIHSVIGMTKFYDTNFVTVSAKSGYNHLYKYGNSGNKITQITNGDWNVTDYYGYDSKTKSYYFQSTEEGAINRTVSRIETVKNRIFKISTEKGWNSARFNTNFNYYVLNYSSATTPNTYSLYNNKKCLRVIENNDQYKSVYTDENLPVREFFTFTTGGNTFNGYMIKPVDFDSSKKYPVIMSQYSGPGSQSVKNSWKFDWEQYAATQGYIVACVDGRGTGGRDKAWESSVYMQMGNLESVDQVAAANYMASLPYVNGDKIGIYGWSFGGYETLMAMSQPNAPYAAGAAVAPVTDWRFYDTIYTERYMRTPQQNKEGYDGSSAINLIHNMNGKLLIIAGTADDNVHIKNTYQYVANLISQNKICDMFVFPNMNHSINGCESRNVVYIKILDFFNQHLK